MNSWKSFCLGNNVNQTSQNQEYGNQFPSSMEKDANQTLGS